MAAYSSKKMGVFVLALLVLGILFTIFAVLMGARSSGFGANAAGALLPLLPLL